MCWARLLAGTRRASRSQRWLTGSWLAPETSSDLCLNNTLLQCHIASPPWQSATQVSTGLSAKETLSWGIHRSMFYLKPERSKKKKFTHSSLCIKILTVFLFHFYCFIEFEEFSFESISHKKKSITDSWIPHSACLHPSLTSFGKICHNTNNVQTISYYVVKSDTKWRLFFNSHFTEMFSSFFFQPKISTFVAT